MTDNIYPVNTQVFTATTEFDGNFLEFGGPTPQGQVGVVTLQFTPDVDWDGQFVVMARAQGNDARVARVPFVPVSYKRINVGGAVADRGYTADAITGIALIDVPTNAQSIGLLMSCMAGTCQIAISRAIGTMNV